MQSEGCILSSVASLLALMSVAGTVEQFYISLRACLYRRKWGTAWTADTTHKGQFDLLEMESSTAQNEPCCSRECHRFNHTVSSIVQFVSLWRTEGLRQQTLRSLTSGTPKQKLSEIFPAQKPERDIFHLTSFFWEMWKKMSGVTFILVHSFWVFIVDPGLGSFNAWRSEKLGWLSWDCSLHCSWMNIEVFIFLHHYIRAHLEEGDMVRILICYLIWEIQQSRLPIDYCKKDNCDFRKYSQYQFFILFSFF